MLQTKKLMKAFPIYTLEAKDYPPLLQEIPDPPPQLYYRGNIELLNTQCISVVGSRNITAYGKQCIEKFIPEFSQYLTIISGLAFGVDALTHLKTLESQGNTIAVLPCSLEDHCISPQSNFYIAKKILQHGGLIISEYRYETPAHKGNFIARNRIIAALSMTTLIVQAALKSGTLLTASHAREYNRNVAVIPGNIFDSVSEGCHSLLQQGAYCISKVKNILELYNITTKNLIKKVYTPENLAEEILLKHITQYPTTIDKIYNSCKLETKIINSTISILEIKGIISQNHKGIFRVK